MREKGRRGWRAIKRVARNQVYGIRSLTFKVFALLIKEEGGIPHSQEKYHGGGGGRSRTPSFFASLSFSSSRSAHQTERRKMVSYFQGGGEEVFR